MVKAYFISDIHLGASLNQKEKEKEQKLLRFLRSVKDSATHLYIVGDLFDFWFEYKYVVPKSYFPVLYQLKELHDSGVAITYLAGNHDFSLGDFFTETLQIQIFPDSYEFELAGKRFYLYHGDGLAKRDSGYRLLKKILRSRWAYILYRWLHPDIGIPFARLVSGTSRHYTQHINLKDEQDYEDFALQQFARGIDFVMMGHRHNPKVLEQGQHKYLNLGDWISHCSFGYFDGKDLKLNYFE